MSETISSFSGSAISSSGSPEGTTASLSRSRWSTTPLIGERSAITFPSPGDIALAAIRLVRARACSACAKATPDSAARTASRAVSARRRADSMRSSESNPSLCRLSCLANSDTACSCSAVARSRSTRERSIDASLVLTRASASARVRVSKKLGFEGRNRASTVEPPRTSSPGSWLIRSTRPANGAETMYRSRTLVWPSSSSVTRSGPRTTVAKSASCGFGWNAK